MMRGINKANVTMISKASRKHTMFLHNWPHFNEGNFSIKTFLEQYVAQSSWLNLSLKYFIIV